MVSLYLNDFTAGGNLTMREIQTERLVPRKRKIQREVVNDRMLSSSRNTRRTMCIITMVVLVPDHQV